MGRHRPMWLINSCHKADSHSESFLSRALQIVACLLSLCLSALHLSLQLHVGGTCKTSQHLGLCFWLHPQREESFQAHMQIFLYFQQPGLMPLNYLHWHHSSPLLGMGFSHPDFCQERLHESTSQSCSCLRPLPWAESHHIGQEKNLMEFNKDKHRVLHLVSSIQYHCD